MSYKGYQLFTESSKEFTALIKLASELNFNIEELKDELRDNSEFAEKWSEICKGYDIPYLPPLKEPSTLNRAINEALGLSTKIKE